MDSASLVLVSIGILFVMQLVTIALVIKGNKTAPKGREEPSSRPQENRPERDRPKHRPDRFSSQRPENRQNTSDSSGQKNSSVDKSLREINLRLRNAERDQQRARQTLDQGGQPGGGRRSDRRGRGRRGNKRRDNRDNRYRDRDDRPGGNGPDRGRDNEATPPPRPSFEQSSPKPEPQVRPAEKTAEQKPASFAPPPEENPRSAPSPLPEDMEHGRKITVKRRVLKGEGEGGGQEHEQTPGPVDESNQQKPDSSPRESQPQDGPQPGNEDTVQSTADIQFGRR
ncbi:MAG: hypothetical protein GF418_08670 [Chitinivibrionales bacterium]|nr:hypothetical protein [Chitinivibrionales bacterium]MBD3395686.1 hypothetical protein [Chitinivibrionales bacterium]